MKLAALLTGTLVLAGCDLAFPIDDVDAPDALVDASGTSVHVTWNRHIAINNADGAPVDTIDTGGGEAYTAFAPDGTEHRVITDDAGELDFALPFDATRGERYRLVRTDSRTDFPIELQDDALDARFTLRRAGRFDSEPTQPTSSVRMPAIGAPGFKVLVASTGLWSQTEVTNAAAFTPWVFDWNQANAPFAPIGRLDAGANDALFVLAFAPTNGVFTIRRAALGTFTVTDAESTFGVTLSDLLPTSCIDVDPTIAAERMRIQSSTPFAVTSSNWELQALPAPDTLADVGATTVVFSPQATDNTTIGLAYANPYFGSLAISSGTNATRPVHIPTPRGVAAPALTAFLTTRTVERFAPTGAPTPPCASIAITNDIEVAGAVSARGIGFSDGADVSLGTAPTITFEWTMIGLREPDYYTTTLVEITLEPDAQGTTVHVVRPVRAFITDRPSVEIPTSALMEDHYYLLVTSALGGYPDVASGNYTTIATSFASSTTWQPLFHVTP